MTELVIQPLPPVPNAMQATDSGGMMTQPLQQWLVNLRDKVNQINSVLVAISGAGSIGKAFDLLSPLTTTGDMLSYSGGTNTRIPVGANGEFLSVVSGYPSWVSSAATSPLTTKGDIYVYGSSNTRLPVGSNNSVLSSNSSSSYGLSWVTLGSAAYQATSAFDSAGSAATAQSNAEAYTDSSLRPIATPTISVSAYTFLTAVGGETSASLLINGYTLFGAPTVTAIHRTDWQGRLALSSSARTNYLFPSDAIASWSKSSSITESAATAFTGTSMAPQLVTNSGSISSASISPTGASVASGAACAWIVVETASSNKSPVCMLRLYDTTAGAYVIGATLNLLTGATARYAGTGTYGASLLSNSGPNGGTVYLLWVSGNVTSGHATSVSFYPTSDGNTAGAVIVHCAQVEAASSPNEYIRTTTAAVTVTDYTLSGSAVSFGQAAVAGAVYDWDGSGIPRYTAAFAGGISIGQYSKTKLPDVATYQYFLIIVTDASSGPALCLSNGTNWININTNLPVS